MAERLGCILFCWCVGKLERLQCKHVGGDLRLSELEYGSEEHDFNNAKVLGTSRDWLVLRARRSYSDRQR